MESKQTAIQWLMEELEAYGDRHHCKLEWEDLESLIQQALEKEKEQKIEFSKSCLDKALDLDIRTAYTKVEQYYEQTYGM